MRWPVAGTVPGRDLADVVTAAGDTTLVVLRLEGRDHALRVTDVAEVLRMVAYVPVPGAPASLAGVINLRGQTVPLLDLRVRLGMPPRPPGLETRIVVVAAGGRTLGLLADEVVETLILPASAIEPPDRLAGPAHPISAVARAGERVILVLDPDSLGAVDDRLSLSDAGIG